MATERKQEIVESLEEKLSRFTSAVLVNYSGLNMAEQLELRDKMGEHGLELKIVKNTLLKLAMQRSDMSFFEDQQLAGQNAVVFGFGDVISAPKTVVELTAEYKKLQVRSGFMKDRVLTEQDVQKLAKIPGREQLYAKVVGSLASPLSGLVNVLQGNIRGLVQVLEAYKQSMQTS